MVVKEMEQKLDIYEEDRGRKKEDKNCIENVGRRSLVGLGSWLLLL